MVTFVGAVCCGLHETLIIVIQPAIQNALSSNIFASTFLCAQFTFGQSIGYFMGPTMLDKLGRVRAIQYACLGIIICGMIYAAVQTTELLSFTLLVHGFSLGVLMLGCFIQLYETLHVKRNQYVVALFFGKSIGSLFAVLLGNSVINALQGSWGIAMAFAALVPLAVLILTQIYMIDSPLYLLAMNEEQRLSNLLQYISDLEYNQFWHILPNRAGNGEGNFKVDLSKLRTERFEPNKVGRFWLNIPELFQYSVTLCLIFFWSVHEQNNIADDEYYNLKIQFLFYTLGLPFFNDLFWQFFPIAFTYATIEYGRKIIMIVAFAFSAVMLIFQNTIQQNIKMNVQQNIYQNIQQNIYNNSSVTPYQYFQQYIWFSMTMFGLRIIEPTLVVFTMENFPTHIRSTALGLMLTFQLLSRGLVKITEALLSNLSQTLFYSVLAFLLLVSSILACYMRNLQFNEFEQWRYAEDEYEMKEMDSETQDHHRMAIQQPLINGYNTTRQIEYEPSYSENHQRQAILPQSNKDLSFQSSSIQIVPKVNLDPKLLKRIRELNQKYLND